MDQMDGVPVTEKTQSANLADRASLLATSLGAEWMGIADLSGVPGLVAAYNSQPSGEFPRAFSIGIGLLHSIVDQLPHRAERAVALTYQYHAYELVNQRLDLIASRLAGLLQREGYSAMPVPASQTVDEERLCGIFSHKMAAHLAGLGWIGKSCLLITPEVGPRVRWATVLTDAPLDPTGQPMDEQCGTCQQCVDACPPGAFTGEPFRVGESRESRFAAHKCRQYFDELEASHGLPVCGMCLYICPFGRKRQTVS